MTQESRVQIDQEYNDIERMIDDLYGMAKNYGATHENQIQTIILLRRKIFDQKIRLFQ